MCLRFVLTVGICASAVFARPQNEKPAILVFKTNAPEAETSASGNAAQGAAGLAAVSGPTSLGGASDSGNLAAVSGVSTLGGADAGVGAPVGSFGGRGGGFGNQSPYNNFDGFAPPPPRNHRAEVEAVFEQFFPDAWLTTYKAIPDATAECICSNKQIWRDLARAKSAADVWSLLQPSVLIQTIQKSCPNDSDKVLAFLQAVQTTVNQLPDSLKTIVTQYLDKLDAVKYQIRQDPTVVIQYISDLLHALQALTSQDWEQVAVALPKLRDLVTAPELTQFLGGLVKIADGVQEAEVAAMALAQKLPKSVSSAFMPPGSNTWANKLGALSTTIAPLIH